MQTDDNLSIEKTSEVGAVAADATARTRDAAGQERIERNRQRALDLFNARVVANDRNVKIVTRGAPIHQSQPIDSGGGFFVAMPPLSQSREVVHFDKSEEETDTSGDGGDDEPHRRKKRRKLRSKEPSTQPAPSEKVLVLPRPPDEEKPVCDECSRVFDDSYLLSNFDCQVCDGCRDPRGIHSMLSRTAAKERYLLTDVDLDVREPPLRRVYRKNPLNSTWGDMQLFLEAQVAARALEVWGSEEKVEMERENRTIKRQKAKLRGFQKRVKELRIRVRSSLYTKKSIAHEHTFGPEVYDEETDTYSKSCTSCAYTMTFEKM